MVPFGTYYHILVSVSYCFVVEGVSSLTSIVYRPGLRKKVA
jgi:hypothetical protein